MHSQMSKWTLKLTKHLNLFPDRCLLEQPGNVNDTQLQMVNILLDHLHTTYEEPTLRFGELIDMITDMRRLSEWYSNITKRLCQSSSFVQRSELLSEIFNLWSVNCNCMDQEETFRHKTSRIVSICKDEGYIWEIIS